jgi:hypothetical protein
MALWLSVCLVVSAVVLVVGVAAYLMNRLNES